jgi:3-hydroxyisobutyrate dehydrogenase-like beta-hydroxyacid dehydrogenase
MATIGLLHPGEMGAAIGAQLVGAGHRVLWASKGRSPQSRERAIAADLVDIESAAGLADASSVIVSICPPAAARDTARSVAGFAGVFVDANAIAPATARAVADLMASSGATYVDGGIIGGPPTMPGDMRLYLSGADADGVAALFDGTVVDVRQLGPDPTAASAIKVAYAAWTKGSAALLIAVREYASRQGIDDALIREWSESQPRLAAQYARAISSAQAKGWRWTDEMLEIANAFDALDLPDGFHQAAADVFGEYDRPD